MSELFRPRPDTLTSYHARNDGQQEQAVTHVITFRGPEN